MTWFPHLILRGCKHNAFKNRRVPVPHSVYQLIRNERMVMNSEIGSVWEKKAMAYIMVKRYIFSLLNMV
jgi:hypothetical protein